MTTIYLAQDKVCRRCKPTVNADPATHMFMRNPIAHENPDCECVRWHSSAAIVTFPGHLGHPVGGLVTAGDVIRLDAERAVCDAPA